MKGYTRVCIRRRRDYFKEVAVAYFALVAEYTPECDPLAQQQQRENFESLLAANRPFAALARECARAWNLENRFEVSIPTGPEA